MISDLPTPAFLVDLDVVERNCRTMLDKARDAGVTLRPHVKTHKTVEGARLQLGGDSGPITVSTLAEAELYADAGFRDITYAVPITPGKLERAVRIQQKVDVLHLLVDHMDAVVAAGEFASANGVRLSIFIKIDCGYHRAGVDPSSDLALELARAIDAEPMLTLAGSLTHGGHSYHASGRDQIAVVAEEERRAVIDFGRRLADAGIAPGTLSTGSTPTVALAQHFEGIDEIRPGNYIFFDAFQASIGSCDWSDCAATVLASVIAIHPDRRQIVIDAGALALSKDRGATHLGDDPGYGVIAGRGGPRTDLRLHTLSQEHGQIEVEDAAVFDHVRIGHKLRIIVNHSCLSAALYDRYQIVRGEQVVDEWRPVRGW